MGLPRDAFRGCDGVSQSVRIHGWQAGERRAGCWSPPLPASSPVGFIPACAQRPNTSEQGPPPLFSELFLLIHDTASKGGPVPMCTSMCADVYRDSQTPSTGWWLRPSASLFFFKHNWPVDKQFPRLYLLVARSSS